MYKILFLFFIIGDLLQAQPKPIPCGHAHNDYDQDRPPLTAALQAGMTSIEIDVYPRKGQLKVAHLPFLLHSKKDLEALYFRPLAELAERQTSFYENPDQCLVLMIDIKENSAESYRLLRALAEKYQSLLNIYSPNGDTLQQGRIELLVSGKKPFAELSRDSVWYMRLDGSLGAIGSKEWTAFIAPRVSAHYPFRWKGKGEMPAKELQQLRNWGEQAKADGRQLRFWAIPQNESVWEVLWREDVYWLNIDDIVRFKEWWDGRQNVWKK